jgi:hypothetical protein
MCDTLSLHDALPIYWLRENGLARYDTNGAWEGLLVAIAQNGQTPIAFRNGLVDMLSHLRNPKSVQVDTHLDSYALLLGNLLAQTGLSDEQIAEFYRRDGGRKYPLFADEAEATAAQAAAILAADRLAAKSAIETRAGAASFAAAASYDAGDGVEAITAAGEAAWEAS